jgi:hypothetical protein
MSQLNQHFQGVPGDLHGAIKRTALATAIGVALGASAGAALADLSPGATLLFDPGTVIITSCLDGSDPATGCDFTFARVTDMGGSYFRMDQGGDPADEKTALSMFAPIVLGQAMTSSGQHTGAINGSESPAIDNPWGFFGNTGMHTLLSGVSVIDSDVNNDGGFTQTLDFSGWGVNWGNYGPGGTDGGTIPMGGVATIVCDLADCASGSNYVLDMAVHVPAAFTSVPYSLHLEGTVSQVPVPAAVWLLGSGIVGLVGVARRRRNKV